MTWPQIGPYSVSMGSVSTGDGSDVVSETDVVSIGVGDGAGVVAGVVAFDDGGCVVTAAGAGSVAGASASGSAQPATKGRMARIASIIVSSFFILHSFRSDFSCVDN